MHIVKGYDERKSEFLNTAMGLFMKHGYENTSVNMIIETVGVSKGAFYHYFKTKEDLMDELSQRTAEDAIKNLIPLMEDSSLSALDKLNELFLRTNAFKVQNRELFLAFMEVYYGDHNIYLRNRMTKHSVERVVPLMEQIIIQGNSEGTMKVNFPRETALFILQIGGFITENLIRRIMNKERPEEKEKEIRIILQVYNESVERILGIAEGLLHLMDDSIINLISGV